MENSAKQSWKPACEGSVSVIETSHQPNFMPGREAEMKSSETLYDEKLVQPSRRAVLQGAAALTAAAVLAPNAATADSHEAEANRYSGDKVFASKSKNIVETDSGKVSGCESGGIITFKGIPYADTTAGMNRFMPAVKPKPWAGVRTALHWGPVAPQNLTSSWGGRRAGWTHDDEAFMCQWTDGVPSEDCLRVNVWTPAADTKKRPVMFWIHGGGFVNGNSNEAPSYDGENLARRGDLVVVSVNHRLGPLGFMNLAECGDQYKDSANVGVLDLIFALEWVKTNISNFGGDPGSVFIYGQSGGGGKVSTLMGMPAAKGLFHRAAIQSSGTPIHQLGADISAQTAAAMLQELGIDKSNPDKLHQLPNEAIIEASVKIAGLARNPGAAQPGLGGWGPVIDGHNLLRHVWDPAAPEPSADVPLLIGSVLNEMGNSVQMGNAALEDMPMDEVKKRLSKQFAHSDAVIDSISKEHTIHKPFDIFAIAQGLPRRVDAIKISGLKADQGKAPAFVYKFVWQSPMVDGRARAFHTSELPFVFFNSEKCSAMTGGGPEPMALAERVSDAWINFARKGNPSHPGLPPWPAFSKDTNATMVFDTQCELKKNCDNAQVDAAKENFGS
jgi:para-nitrobenzyl esterase